MEHRLGLATRTQISVCKSPFPSAGTAVSLFRAKTVQQRPLLPREVETSDEQGGVQHDVHLTNIVFQESRSFEASHCLFFVLNRRQPSFSSHRCTDPEQSSAAYHICSVTSRLLLSPEDILLRTLFLVITVVVPAKYHRHLWIC